MDQTTIAFITLNMASNSLYKLGVLVFLGQTGELVGIWKKRWRGEEVKRLVEQASRSKEVLPSPIPIPIRSCT